VVLIRKIRQILQNQNPFRNRPAVVAVRTMAAAMAAGGEMLRCVIV
jgi:hypothetical protein